MWTPLFRGPDWMPITPKWGSFLHADSHAPIGDALLFRNRSGAPYSKDTLGDDFREIREMVLGPEDDRQLADLRRSGTVEAFAGKADPASVSSKMANTLSASNRLHNSRQEATKD